MVADSSCCQPIEVAECAVSESINNINAAASHCGISTAETILTSGNSVYGLKLNEISKESVVQNRGLASKDCQLSGSACCNCDTQQAKTRKLQTIGNGRSGASCFLGPENCFSRAESKAVTEGFNHEDVQWVRRPSLKVPGKPVSIESSDTDTSGQRRQDGGSERSHVIDNKDTKSIAVPAKNRKKKGHKSTVFPQNLVEKNDKMVLEREMGSDNSPNYEACDEDSDVSAGESPAGITLVTLKPSNLPFHGLKTTFTSSIDFPRDLTLSEGMPASRKPSLMMGFSSLKQALQNSTGFSITSPSSQLLDASSPSSSNSSLTFENQELMDSAVTKTSAAQASSSSLTSKCTSLPLLPSVSDTEQDDIDVQVVPLVRSASLPINVQKGQKVESLNRKEAVRLLCPSAGSTSSSCCTSPGSPHPFLPRSTSCPTARPSVSALRGGKQRPPGLHVKWAPEVWDPIPSSASHTLSSLSSLQRNKHKSKHSSSGHGKRKGDGSKGRRSTKSVSSGSTSKGGGGGTMKNVVTTKDESVGGLLRGEQPWEVLEKLEKGCHLVDNLAGLQGTSKYASLDGVMDTEGVETHVGSVKEGGSFSEGSLGEGVGEDKEWTVVSKKGGRGGGRMNIKAQDQGLETKSRGFEAIPVSGDKGNLKNLFGSATREVVMKDELFLRTSDCLVDDGKQKGYGMATFGFYEGERRCAVA